MEKVSLIRDLFEYYTLIKLEEQSKEPPSLEPVVSYCELQRRIALSFGPNSMENLFIKSMLEMPVRSDLSKMLFFRDEELARQVGGNWIVIPTDESLPAKYCLNHFKTQRFAERYITGGELSMDLTKALRDALLCGIEQEIQKGISVFPSPKGLGKFVQAIGDRVNIKLNILFYGTCYRRVLNKR